MHVVAWLILISSAAVPLVRPTSSRSRPIEVMGGIQAGPVVPPCSGSLRPQSSRVPAVEFLQQHALLHTEPADSEAGDRLRTD